MKQMMLDMMSQMMPFMKPLVWLGVVAGLVGAVMVLASLLFKANSGDIVLIAGRILLGLALFLFACEGAGLFLGARPQINFGDFEKLEFVLVPFWQIGAAFLAGALILGFFGGRLRTS
ncbi:MAG: hypothetical protein NW217_11185 [Hyphomicrobiaceae bacterium]|nr:hypothetical protein [Hyphomicrobiaceae bacterium]